MKVKFNYSRCSIAVSGMDMDCPLCGTPVPSGTTHQCEKKEPQQLPKPRKTRKLKRATEEPPHAQ